MAYCELCGKKTEKLVKVYIEGTILNVCEECARYGKIIEEKTKQPKVEAKKEIIEKYYDIVEDYDQRIREARERLGLSQEEFCKKYNISLNVLKKIEKKELVPDLKLAKKLEKILKIKLIEEKRYIFTPEETEEEKSELTFADVVELK